MNAFQYLTVGLMAVLATVTMRSGVRGLIRKRIALFWLMVWGGSAVTVLWPQSTAIAARALGIGRGTDLVLYLSVVATLTGFFYVYGRFRRMDRQMTVLVRRLAIEQARRPEPSQSPPPTA